MGTTAIRLHGVTAVAALKPDTPMYASAAGPA